MAKKLTKTKARQILHDKEVHGQPLTDKQRRFFGAIAGGDKPYKAQIGGLITGFHPKLAETASDVLSAPQKAVTQLVTGKYQTPSEALDIQNRAGAFFTDIVLDPLSFLGVGAAKKVGALDNISKINPFRFKEDPNAYYRMLGGKKGFDDAVKAGILRPASKQLDFVPFIQGQVPDTKYAGPYMVEVKDIVMTPKGMPLHEYLSKKSFGKYGQKDLIFAPEKTKPPIQTTSPNVKFYKKDWLRGYKEVKLPKKKEDGGAVEGRMAGLTDKGFNFNPAWGGAWRNGGVSSQYSVPEDQLRPRIIIPGVNYNLPGTAKLTQNYQTNLNLPASEQERIGLYARPDIDVWDRKPYVGATIGYRTPKLDVYGSMMYGSPTLGATINFQNGGNLQPPMAGAMQPALSQQFAMGGSLPGSVGFTYARVAGAAPSEGPRAKKTLPSAQDGIAQPELQESADWFKTWYQQRQALPQFNRVATQRLDLLSNKLPGIQLAPIEELQKIGAVATYSQARSADPTKDILTLADPATVPAYVQRLEKERGVPLKYPVDPNIGTHRSVVGHELSHFLDARARQTMYRPRGVRKSDPYEKYPVFSTKYKKTKDLDLDTYKWLISGGPGPKTEINSVLNELRQREGLRGDQLSTPEQMQKIINKYMDLPEDQLIEQSTEGSQNNRIRALLKYFLQDPEKLSDINNRIVAAPREGDVPMAQNGMEMKYYQEGLDWKPKTISKNGGWLDKFDDGGVVKDDMGYWNPENVGKVVEIDSPYITMKGVDQPLIGVSNTGDVQYMEPGNDYEFDGTSVREYPVAQRGRQVSSRTSGPRLPLSPLIATAADSLLLYKNALEKERFYRNNPDYKVVNRDVVNETSLKDRKFLQELADESVTTYDQFKKPNIYNDSFSFGYSNNQMMVPNKVVYNKLGRVEGSNVLYKAPDITRTIDTYHNPNAPVILFSPQIIPQGERVYFSETFGDRSRIPHYEPLAVKPYAMRTEKEKVEWERKYGKSKPEPKKPPVKKETPKVEAKKEAPTKSVPQTTDQLSMFRNANVELLVDQFGNYEWFRKDDPGDMIPVRRATREEIEYSKKQKQRNGGVSVNKADEYPLEKLDNLFNFTNYNKPKAKSGGWLDKYN